MKPFLSMSARFLMFVCVLSGLPTRGDCSAAAADQLLASVSKAIAESKSIEYTSVIQVTDSSGSARKLYVHMKVQKPNLINASFSTKDFDDPSSYQIVSNATAVYEYDPAANEFSVSPPIAQNFEIKQDFIHAGGLIFRIAGTFLSSNSQPFVDILPQDADHPLSLSRRSGDLPGTQVVTSYMGGNADAENLAKLWVSNSESLPKRLVLSILQNGAESVSYEEDWQSFKLDPNIAAADFNPKIPIDAGKWTPPTAAAGSGAGGTTTVGTPVNLSASFNNAGIISDGHTFNGNGGINGFGVKYSSTLLGKLNWDNTRFAFGTADGWNTVTCVGQIVPLPAGNFSSLRFLASAYQGENTSTILTLTFTVTYNDGSSSQVTQDMSQMTSPKSCSGETAFPMAYLDLSTGNKFTGTANLYGYAIPLDSGKAVKSITLPLNRAVKILAMSLLN